MTLILPDTKWEFHVMIDFAIDSVASEGIQLSPRKITLTLPDTTWYLHVMIDFAIVAVLSEGIQPVPMVNDVNITRHDMILTRHNRLCHRRRTRLMYACRCRTQQWREHGIRRWPVLWSLRRLPTCNGIERLKILEVNLSWGCRVVDMPAADIPLSCCQSEMDRCKNTQNV